MEGILSVNSYSMSAKKSKPTSYPFPQRVVVASRIVLRDRLSHALVTLLTPVIGMALFLIPVHVIPGNTIAIQSRLYRLNDYILLACIAGLESLLIAMYVYRAVVSILARESNVPDNCTVLPSASRQVPTITPCGRGNPQVSKIV